ncbi:MAG TPA: chemotaxis protein CheB, partial [Minicystis sp.]|nr:chemotaxis protein CheB [Minicystis sp.]
MARGPVFTVGIGASAGGVEALERFFEGVGASTGSAFVVVQHLSPDFKSMMDEILSRRTVMPVHVAADGARVAPDSVYVNAPGTELAIEDGVLRVTAVDAASRPAHPIDHFLRSLAADAGSKAVAVILSGTGNDGAEGVACVKRAGGFVLAQDPATAAFDGMPRAAIATGCVDVTLALEQMPAMLLSLGFQGTREGDAATALEPVIQLVEQRHGIDFSHYKVPTLARRIERRMHAAGCDELGAYVARLRSDPVELGALYRDLLIGVTQFFRDPEVFERIGTVWLPELLDKLKPGEELRAWVAGCATGEEAYSLAMVMREALDARGLSNPARIFATDVHREALRVAAPGVYDTNQVRDVTPARRERFFTKKDGAYQVTPALRSMIVFAPHDVLKDVPFNRLDLVTCRNLLIYLEPSAQRRVLSTFHFALKPHGALILGPSESLSDLGHAFDTLDDHGKVFRKKPDARLAPHVPSSSSLRAHVGPPLPRPLPPVDASLVGAYHAVLEAVMPAALLVGQQRNLVQTFGGASRYLRVPEGRATNDVVDMVGGDL